jgi:hypothetical protein
MGTKDIILLAIGALLSFFISWYFSKTQYYPEASYHLKDSDEFYYVCINGFKTQIYFKRPINGFKKIKISEMDFEKVKHNLQRRTIDF